MEYRIFSVRIAMAACFGILGLFFFDATKWVGDRKGLPDGLTVDHDGNIWATGPGGILVFSPEGKLLGVLHTGQATANCTFGEDGSSLFITADMHLCRIRTNANKRK